MTEKERALKAWAKHKQTKTRRQVADSLGIPNSTFCRWVADAEGGMTPNMRRGNELWNELANEIHEAAKPKSSPKAKAVAEAPNIPLSEDQRLFHAHWTAADCITHLLEMAEANPTKVITRNFFRNNSDISESTWNRYFGTFQEFKRQAGVILSRHAHRLERHIAKHASVDIQKVTNEDKHNWEGAYLRPSSKRFQTVAIANDLHGKQCDPFYIDCWLDTLARAQPEKIVFNGDLFDLTEFSRFVQDPRDFDILGDIEAVHNILADTREVCPDAEIFVTEGNHEFRLLRHMSEQTPALMVILDKLHGFTVDKLLGLNRFEVNFIARADLRAWTEKGIKEELRKNYLTLYNGGLLFGHYSDMRGMGIPGSSGHNHKHIVWPDYSPKFGPWEWHQVGCGHRREATYCAGEQWANGFLLAHHDLNHSRTQFEYLDVTGDAAMIGGVLYTRDAHAPVIDLV